MAFPEFSIPYKLSRHPDAVAIEDALKDLEAGTNCQLFVGVIVHAMGKELPVLRSAELFADLSYTEPVPGLEEARTGDIIFLTREGQSDPRRLHIGILFRDSGGKLSLIDNARHVGFARHVELAEAMEDPRHTIVAGIKRPIIDNPQGPDAQFLARHGLRHLVA
jgi:hypothetical protein